MSILMALIILINFFCSYSVYFLNIVYIYPNAETGGNL